LKIDASFVKSAAGARDLPRDALARIALVGRSNVGKSSLINALVRRRLARTSAAPGLTRLANWYRVSREREKPFYLVDLPGYGYAKGGPSSSREFEKLTASVFGEGQHRQTHRALSALLIVDARHPGLESDRAAWEWMQETVAASGIVATKIDKLARGRRIRAIEEIESVFRHPVAAVSAATGEGLNELWKLIARLTKHE